MIKKTARCSLRQSLSELIEKVDLGDPSKKAFLEERWLRKTLWYERMAVTERRVYYLLRLLTIVGALLIPTILGLSNTTEDGKLKNQLAWWAFGVGQAVAITAALEEFIAPADKLKDYRQSSEDMQREGWHFFQLTGPYRQYSSHDGAYRSFVERVEMVIEKNVQERLSLLEDQLTAAAKGQLKLLKDGVMQENVEILERLKRLEEERIPAVEPLATREDDKSTAVTPTLFLNSGNLNLSDQSPSVEPAAIFPVLSSLTEPQPIQPAVVKLPNGLPALGRYALTWEE